MRVYSDLAEGISAVSFGWYGLTCFFSKAMVAEFERWRLPTLRILTGTLQIAAGVGLILGHFFSRPVLLVSAGGLAAMMFCALLARLRVRDHPYAALPAFSLMVLNLFIVFSAF